MNLTEQVGLIEMWFIQQLYQDVSIRKNCCAAESFKGQVVASLFLTQESMSYMTLQGDTHRTSCLQSDKLEAAHTPADGIQVEGACLGRGADRGELRTGPGNVS